MSKKPEDPIVMYFVVNGDLKMSKGKVASQVAHCCQKIVGELIRKGYETHPTPKEVMTFLEWELAPTKIVLRATKEEIAELCKMPDARCEVDDGDVKVAKGSVTAVGFLPSNQHKKLFEKFTLLG